MNCVEESPKGVPSVNWLYAVCDGGGGSINWLGCPESLRVAASVCTLMLGVGDE